MKRRTVVVETPGALGRIVAQTLSEGPSAAHRRVEAGAVYVDGKRVKEPTRLVPSGATVSIVLEAGGVSSEAQRAPAAPLVVVFEDDEVLAVDKPPGLPAQPTPEGEPSLLDLASAHLGRPAGLVHRLDRETSGVTVFGKTPAATSALAEAFREGRAVKTYLAIVAAEVPERGFIDTPLQKDPSRPGRWRALRSGGGVSAETAFERVWVDGGRALVRLTPRTGRTHQLRAHLTSIGFPIAGDRLYGGPDGPRCLLHAVSLVIGPRRFEAGVPSDFPHGPPTPS
ncbi:MAG: RluA family pseudouridine synthase [Myxococcaceae bacterium]|nr:RluA family pseudouridine synthase [Myxococcaceae bacterium]